jgi:hypothetical protein
MSEQDTYNSVMPQTDQSRRAMDQVANAVASLRAGSISTMSAWQAVVDAVDRYQAATDEEQR